MPSLEDPARLSKSRLKSDLLAHNVPLPPANSRKEVYVELHLKHIDQRNAAEFSSDEEDRGQDEAVSLSGILGAHLPVKPASFASPPRKPRSCCTQASIHAPPKHISRARQ